MRVKVLGLYLIHPLFTTSFFYLSTSCISWMDRGFFCSTLPSLGSCMCGSTSDWSAPAGGLENAIASCDERTPTFHFPTFIIPLHAGDLPIFHSHFAEIWRNIWSLSACGASWPGGQKGCVAVRDFTATRSHKTTGTLLVLNIWADTLPFAFAADLNLAILNNKKNNSFCPTCS